MRQNKMQQNRYHKMRNFKILANDESLESNNQEENEKNNIEKIKIGEK